MKLTMADVIAMNDKIKIIYDLVRVSPPEGSNVAEVLTPVNIPTTKNV